MITALTAQNTQGVQGIFPISPDFVEQQYQSISNDIEIHAVKIGMLFEEKIITLISKYISQLNCPVVLDPVITAQSGDALLQPNTINILQQHLFPQATVITPNLPEAELLLGKKIIGREAMALSAKTLGEQYKTSILIKGGHLIENKASDVLYIYKTKQHQWFYADKIHTNHCHGTGCTLSSAIAAYLAKGNNLIESISQAKKIFNKSNCVWKKLSIRQRIWPSEAFFLSM